MNATYVLRYNLIKNEMQIVCTEFYCNFNSNKIIKLIVW